MRTDALRCIHQYWNSLCVSRGNDFCNGIEGTQGIGNMGECQDFYLGVEQVLQCLQIQFSFVVKWDDLQLCFFGQTNLLPGNQIGMMLHCTDQNLISGLQAGQGKTLGYQIDSIRSPAGKNNLFGLWRVEETGTTFATAFVQGSCLGSQSVNPTVYIGVVLLVVFSLSFNHYLRFLGGGRIVEVHQIGEVLKNRKALPNLLWTEHW